jgi:hypothetical protein
MADMTNISVPERVFLCLAAVSILVLIVGLLAFTIAENRVAQNQRPKQPPMLGVISDSNSVRLAWHAGCLGHQ